MKKMDNNGLLLCKIQANLFENYSSFSNSSPYFFIRRFMHSDLAKRFDDMTVLLDASSNQTFINELDEQYGKSSFGKSVKVDKETLYWVGYIYRYWSYIYEVPSDILVNYITPDKLISRYPLYHSMEMKYAIDRIAEEEDIHIAPNKTIEELLKEYLTFIEAK